MELDFPSTLVMLLVSSSLFIVLLCMLLHKSTKPDVLNRIPGPKRLPLIGNLHLLATKSPPHRVFRDLAAEYGPLMRLQLGGVPFLIVSSVEAAKEVLKTHDTTFANRPQLFVSPAITYNHSDIAGAPYGDRWRHLRKICTLELLSVKRVKSFHHIREAVNSDLAKLIASNEGSSVNLSDRVYLSTFDVASRACVGKETEEKRATTAAIKRFMKLASGLTIADLYPSIRLLPVVTGLRFKIQRIFRQTDRILQRIIDGHREARANNAIKRSEDLVDVLLKYQQHGAELHLTNDNIKGVMMDVFLAGGDTSGSVVDWAMSEMMRNPSTLEKAQEEVRRVMDDKGNIDEEKFNELKYLKLVIKETLRMHPPFPLLLPRENSERCEINGYEIPAKTRVLVNAWALGRDPKYWKDAENFKPERFEDSSIDFKGNNFEYIPFGGGRRICPGISFGLANVEFPLAMLLYHFDWKISNEQKLDMTEDFGISVRRKHDLLLIPTLKRPLVV